MLTLSVHALLRSAQRALLFNITPTVRFVSVDIAEPDKLLMWVYFEKEPSNDEREMFYAVAGEINGDFPELDISKDELGIFVDDRPYQDLRHLRYLVYARYED